MQKSRNFNPRSPHGERRRSSRKAFSLKKFQSTLPARGATPLQPVKSTKSRFQSTLPARGATNEEMQRVRQKAFQSTLPARGATGAAGCESRHRKISIHAPRTGSDRLLWLTQARLTHFNPRSPHGERLRSKNNRNYTSCISIHAPRTGSDGCFG